jgi:hypothetical protein
MGQLPTASALYLPVIETFARFGQLQRGLVCVDELTEKHLASLVVHQDLFGLCAPLVCWVVAVVVARPFAVV